MSSLLIHEHEYTCVMVPSVGVMETAPDEVDTQTITNRAAEPVDKESQFADRESTADSVPESATIPGAHLR